MTHIRVPISQLPIATPDGNSLMPFLEFPGTPQARAVAVRLDFLATTLGGITPLVAWTTATEYGLFQLVLQDGNIYQALESHLSADFAADLTAGKWALLIDFTSLAISAQEAQVAAEAASVAAEAARDKAQEWATNPEDDPVEVGPDEFSARHWAIKAEDVAVGIASVPIPFAFTGDGATTAFDLTAQLGGAIVTSADQILWFENDTLLLPTTDYTFATNIVTRTAPPANGVNIAGRIFVTAAIQPPISLNLLSDVEITGIQDKNILEYEQTSGKWKNIVEDVSLGALADAVTAAQDGDVLIKDGTLFKAMPYAWPLLQKETEKLARYWALNGITQPRSAVINLYDHIIARLIDAGIWERLDGFYLLAAHNEAAALVNIRNPGIWNLTKINTPIFTVGRGFRQNVDALLNTNFNPLTVPIADRQWRNPGETDEANGAYLAVFDLSQGTSNVGIVGANDLNGHTPITINPRFTDGSLLTRIHDSNQLQTIAINTSFGFIQAWQENGTQGHIKDDNAGTTAVNAIDAPKDATLILLGDRSNQYRECEVPIFAFGRALTLQQRKDMFAIVFECLLLNETFAALDETTISLIAAIEVPPANNPSTVPFRQPSAYREMFMDLVIRGLKEGGVWNKIDAMWITANGVRTIAQFNWKTTIKQLPFFDGLDWHPVDPASHHLVPWRTVATATAPTMEDDRGYEALTNPTDEVWVSSYFNPITEGVVEEDFSMGIWITKDQAVTTFPMGQKEGNDTLRIQPRSAGNASLCRIFDTTNLTVVGGNPNTDARGLWIANRSGTTREFWLNKTLLATDTLAAGVAHNSEITFFADFNVGSVLYDPRQFGFAFVGKALTPTDIGVIHTVVGHWLRTLGQTGSVHQFP